MILFVVVLFMNPDQRPVMTSYEASYDSYETCMSETKKSVEILQANNFNKNATFSCVQKINIK